MNIKLKTNSTLESYTVQNENGHTIHLSGDGTGISPMESLLASVAACSTVDIALILGKMKQDIRHIAVDIKSERRQESPRYFTSMHFHYIIHGNTKEKKVAQAIQSSFEKYCSVAFSINKDIDITTSFVIEDV